MTEYKKIFQHYESCLEKHGDSHKGLDWPNVEGMITRYKVMSDVIKGEEPCNLLDMGCGTGAFSNYLEMHKPQVEYSGADISQKFINLCKKKYPKLDFFCVDMLDASQANQLVNYDYIVMNGIFTAKYDLSHEQMFDFLKKMLHSTFNKTVKGLAFNAMSKHVDWEREDLFHLPHDEIAKFITKELGTRNFIFRNDYGLYEYATYIYK